MPGSVASGTYCIMHNDLFQEDDDSYVDGPEISCYNTGMLIVITNTNSTQFTASQRTSSYNLILRYGTQTHFRTFQTSCQ